ncbi:MAG: hypothetical protein FWE36_04605 [Erysipelotrichales bacterium]|nr:hypothetical protein [Erysipelotrichales bacterium]
MRWNSTSRLTEKINNGNIFQEKDKLTSADLNEMVKEIFIIGEYLDKKYGESFTNVISNGISLSLTRSDAELSSVTFTIPLTGSRIFARIPGEQPLDSRVDNNENNIIITIIETKDLYRIDQGTHNFRLPIEFSWDQNFHQVFTASEVRVEYNASPRSFNFLEGKNILNWTRTSSSFNQQTITIDTSEFTKLPVFADALIRTVDLNRLNASISQEGSTINITITELADLRRDWTLDRIITFQITINFFRDFLHGTRIGTSVLQVNYDPGNELLDLIELPSVITWTRSSLINARTFTIPTNGRPLFAEYNGSQIQDKISVAIERHANDMRITITELERLNGNWTLEGLQHFNIPIDFFAQPNRVRQIGKSVINIAYNAAPIFLDFLRNPSPLNWVRNNNMPRHAHSFIVQKNGFSLIAHVEPHSSFDRIGVIIDDHGTHLDISVTETPHLRDEWINGVVNFIIPVQFYADLNRRNLVGESTIRINYTANSVFINPLSGLGPIQWTRIRGITNQRTFMIPFNGSRMFAQNVTTDYRVLVAIGTTIDNNNPNNLPITFRESQTLNENETLNNVTERFIVLIDFFADAQFTNRIGSSSMEIFYRVPAATPID